MMTTVTLIKFATFPTTRLLSTAPASRQAPTEISVPETLSAHRVIVRMVFAALEVIAAKANVTAEMIIANRLCALNPSHAKEDAVTRYVCLIGVR